MDPQNYQKLALKDVLRNVLEECRMVLPGIQALFGFQLIAVFNTGFTQISALDRNIHLAALLLTICSIGCLMAPASHHRQVERHSVSQGFVNYASKLLCIGMGPLLLSVCLDTYVVTNVITNNSSIALLVGICTFVFLSTLWYLIPNLQKMEKNQHSEKTEHELSG